MSEVIPNSERGSILEADLFDPEVGWTPVVGKGSILEADLFDPTIKIKRLNVFVWTDVDIKVDNIFEPAEVNELPL